MGTSTSIPLAHFSLWLSLLVRPLLSAPPSPSPKPPAPSSCPPSTSGEEEGPLRIQCFTAGLAAPNSGDCFRAMSEILSGNSTADHAPLRFSSDTSAYGTVPLPWSWIQPGCIVLIDVARSATRFDNPEEEGPDYGEVVDILSLVEIAVAAQEIVQRCILGASRLGGRTLIGQHNLVSLYVARAPEVKKKVPVTVTPEEGGLDILDMTLQICGGSL